MDWWLIIGTPGGIRCWPVGPDPDQHERLINAARVLVGMPADDEWVDDDSRWDIQLTVGEPHPTLLERATAGTIDDLRKTDPTAVDAHAAARAQWTADRHLEAVKAALARLDDAALAAVLADPVVADRLEAVPVVVPQPAEPVVDTADVRGGNLDGPMD